VDLILAKPSQRKMPITVVVADDRELLRKVIRGILDCDCDIKIVGEAENFPQTITLMLELAPNVLVMDLHMDAPNDFSPADLKRALADTGSKLITMSIWQDDPSRALAASFGSFTFLDKSCLGALLIPAIKQLTASGESSR
jgi:DNA-binding NarL/FixJ family response regulator